MTHITKLTEIVDGRLLPSDKKLSASLLEVGERLSITGDTLGFDSTGLATETYVSDAILAAQLSKEEVDLSGYATKTDLEGYTTIEGTQLAVSSYVDYAIAGITPQLDLKVDKVEGKGLSTNDFTDVYKTAVDNIETSISTAIAAVVDGAPATFDTLREIAAWIENDGVAATDLASAIVGKADRTEVDGKVDKVVGKGLSTNDFTDSYKDQLDNMTTTVDTQIDDKFNNVYGPSIAANLEGINTHLGTKLDKPDPTAPSTTAPSLENSLPLYTLGNNGEYVLCTPDTWFLINGFYVPGYAPATLGL